MENLPKDCGFERLRTIVPIKGRANEWTYTVTNKPATDTELQMAGFLYSSPGYTDPANGFGIIYRLENKDGLDAIYQGPTQ